MYFSELTSDQIASYKYNELVLLDCPACESKFTRQAKFLRHTSSRKRREMFCSQKCVTDYQKKPKENVVCLSCKKVFEPKYGNMYCSKGCANTSRRQNKKSFCVTCKTEILTSCEMCSKCRKIERLEKSLNVTLLELKNKQPKKSNYHSVVRDKARRVLLFNKVVKECFNCGYDKYVECCHIRPISSFSMSSSLSEINDRSNLVWLCPNCHKELDRGLLKL